MNAFIRKLVFKRGLWTAAVTRGVLPSSQQQRLAGYQHPYYQGKLGLVALVGLLCGLGVLSSNTKLEESARRIKVANLSKDGQRASAATVGRGSKKQFVMGKQKSEKELKKRYKLGKVLGEGTFAVVRLAVDRKNKDRVAIKEICKELSEVDALENEVSIMETTGRHENIVSLRDVFDSDSTLYLVMDLAEGGELFDRIIERGELSEKFASAMFKSAVRGIHHLHQCHICHLDIKPENLLLTSQNDDAGIKIADFGLAIDISNHRESKGEKSPLQECVGTPAYWAPEMVKNETFDEKVDIWALGCVLYIMLCGAHPFDPNGDATEAQILAQVATGKYDKTSPAYLSISSSAKDLIRHMLDPNPKTRYNTEQLLQHPWLSESGKLSTAPLSKDHITRLRGFRIIRLLRQGMQHMLGNAAADLFATFDKDGDGFLDRNELKAALEMVGQKISKHELDVMLKTIDRDNDQRISREEFDLVLRAPAGSPYSSIRQQGTSIEDIEFLFRVFDRDRDGYIKPEDFKHVLGLLGASVSSSSMSHEMEKIDRDQDGKVDLAEFVTYWRAMERERRKQEAYSSVSPLHVKHRPHLQVPVEPDGTEFAEMSH